MIEAVRFPARAAGHGLRLPRIRPPARRFRHRRLRRGRGRTDGVRLAIGGVGDRPTRARLSATLDGGALDDALDAFAWELDARDDLHATARYRRDLVRRLGRATIEEARRCRA